MTIFVVEKYIVDYFSIQIFSTIFIYSLK